MVLVVAASLTRFSSGSVGESRPLRRWRLQGEGDAILHRWCDNSDINAAHVRHQRPCAKMGGSEDLNRMGGVAGGAGRIAPAAGSTAAARAGNQFQVSASPVPGLSLFGRAESFGQCPRLSRAPGSTLQVCGASLWQASFSFRAQPCRRARQRWSLQRLRGRHLGQWEAPRRAKLF